MAIAEITAALGGLKAATELAKALVETNKAMELAEFKLRAADLMGELAQARSTLLDAQDHASALQAEIDRLNGALAAKDQVVREGNAYYQIGEDGKGHGHPYCMRCWEVDHRLHHLSVPTLIHNAAKCPACKSEYMAHIR